MADVIDEIDDELARWIATQPVFFVATAPEGPEGFVNCSPKGGDSLRVLGPRAIAYLDVVGSGVETIAHLKENGRIVVMLCAFDGPPRIVRVHGRGAVVAPGEPGFDALLEKFPPRPGVRAIVKVDALRLSQSCGYGVPLMDFREHRSAMTLWAEKKGEDGLLEYQRTRNAQSLDGLPGVDWLPRARPNDSAMAKLKYTEAELLSDHAYAKPHLIGDRRLHGGFDASGRYVPPRSLVRNAAIDAWTAALRRRGGDLLDAGAWLLTGARVPNVMQQRVLLENGLGQTFWNSLTITGKIEARGRVIAEMRFPDLSKAIVEDISEMAIGHLNKGLLVAHGVDEGGEPDKGIGGHDVMWFVARDLAFGNGAYPDATPPDSIGRPEAGKRWMNEVAPEIEAMLSFLMNLLVIEFRAEIGFATSQSILRMADLFPGRAREAAEAAEIIERIRTDEEIHVRSLRLYLGELRAVTFRTVDGGTIAGSTLIDRFWKGLLQWATVDQPRLAAEQQYAQIKPRILAHKEGARVLAAFDAAGSDPRDANAKKSA